MLLRLLVAGVAGGIVGYERKTTGKRAGIRTMSLVAMGAAVFTLASQVGFLGDGVDASRVASQVATGVGFIGAGTIISNGWAVRGLTTAAAIWASAAFGLAAGAGMFILAIGGALIVTAALAFIPHGDLAYEEEEREVEEGRREQRRPGSDA
ncbi:MAG: hypothetical protein GEU80_09145 [Dehalococcoidia bacterium]|nr:hypothetical protein [Dehalococcoidia bacterium]